MIIPMICSLIIIYFFVYGMRSIQQRSSLREQISVLNQEYSLVHKRRVKIESHVKLLRPDHVNPDFLDQESRKILGLMYRDEIVIPNQ